MIDTVRLQATLLPCAHLILSRSDFESPDHSSNIKPQWSVASPAAGLICQPAIPPRILLLVCLHPWVGKKVCSRCGHRNPIDMQHDTSCPLKKRENRRKRNRYPPLDRYRQLFRYLSLSLSIFLLVSLTIVVD